MSLIKSAHSPQWTDKGTYKEPIDTDNVRVPRLEIDDATTYLDKDGSNNMTLTDAVTGTKTLAQLSAAGTGTVDTSGTPVANDIARFTDADTIEGRSYAEIKADLDLEIGTDVLAQQTIGIADNNLLEVDQADAASGEYAKFTANGLESKSKAEQLSDLNVADGADVTGSNAPQAHKASHETGGGDIVANVAITAGTITGITDLVVADGGTGVSTLTDGGVLLGSGVGAVTTLGQATNGQLVVGSTGADPVVATLGVAQGLVATGGAGTLALSVTQAIADNTILTADDAAAADDDFARFTANGIEGIPPATALTALFAVPLPENTAIEWDAALSADGKYSGIVTKQFNGGATIPFGEIMYLKATDSEWYQAKADVTATSGAVMVGICVLATTDAGACTTLLMGKVRADTKFPTFTISAPVFISAATAGLLTSTAPTGTTNFVVRIVGHAGTGDEIYFNPDNSYVELA